MICSGCGKEIPFIGVVCPYCHRDKSNDQDYTIAAFILGGILGFVGYIIFGLGGAIGGFCIGCIIAKIATGIGVNTKPPEVVIVNENPQNEKPQNLKSEIRQSEYKQTEESLRKLKRLFYAGLIGEDEYNKKKNEILEKL